MDRTIKVWDEPHPPAVLEKISEHATGRFLTDAHGDSYLRQLRVIRELGVKSVLEVGPGEGMVAAYMRSLGIRYDTMDITPVSSPTFLSSLETFEVGGVTPYDLVGAFQMLEHSPYERFVPNLRKMTKLSSRYVFISLPYSGHGFRVSLRFLLSQTNQPVREFSFYFPSFKRNRRYRPEYMMEFPWAVHYWEIGRRGFPLRRILADVASAGLRVVRRFHGTNAFHYFILTEKADALRA